MLQHHLDMCDGISDNREGCSSQIQASTVGCDVQSMYDNCPTHLQAVGRCAAVRGVQALTVPAVSDAQLEEPIRQALQHAVASQLCETGSPVVVLVGSLQAGADPVPVMITRVSIPYSAAALL